MAPSADTEGRKLAGDIVAETDTRTDTTGEARLMVQEFAPAAAARPERELTDAQAYLAGSFPLTIESPNDIATGDQLRALRAAAGGHSRHTTQRITRSRRTTSSGLRRRISSRSAVVVLVGNAKAFVPQLQFPWPDGRRDHSGATARSDVGVAET